MTHYLLDTNHASDLLDEDTDLWKRIDSSQDSSFYLCLPSIAELWFMVFNSGRPAGNIARLEVLLDRMAARDFDAAAAKEYGRIRVELRRLGKPIPAVDIMIAAIARANDFVVLTADQHFQVVAGLRMEDWLHG